MKLKDFAKNWDTSSDVIIETLKSLKLKAKDENQELNAVVLSILKSEFPKLRNSMEDRVSKRRKMQKLEELREERESEEKKMFEKAKKKTTKTKGKTKGVKIITKIEEVEQIKGKKTKKDAKEPKAKEVAPAKKEEKAKKEKQVKPAELKPVRRIIKKGVRLDLTEDIDKKKALKKKVGSESVAEKTKQKKADKKDVTEKTSGKPKPRIMDSPLITLKPLLRKKKKGKQEDKKTGEPDETFAGKGHGQSHRMDPSQKFFDDIKQRIDAGEDLPELELQVPISVKDFSIKVQQKPSMILKQLMKRGVFATINQTLDGEILKSLALDFGFNLTKTKTQEEQLIDLHRQEDDDPKLLKARAPVITFMGHVDHGKTTLIDKIRLSKVADKEHGGITQHTSAYSVKIPKGRITFLDTPGHEAFTAMRARGAHITDIVVLVIAADEGIMPQTREAIDHARAAGVPIVVALNKIDRKNADPDRVKKQLQEVDLAPEDWGGKTIVAGVSAITGEGVDELLELILLESEMLELKANADKLASGIVVEAHLSPGKGSVSTLIVQSGTLKDGDFIVVGPYYGKIRAMFDDYGDQIKEAGPSMPVEIMGLSNVPDAGEMFYAVSDEKQARDISFRRQEQIKNKKLQESQKVTLEDLYSQLQEGTVKELSVIIKSDVQGSLEALKDSLEKIPSDKVKIKFVHLGVGDVNASDVILAVASKAIIIAFHVGIEARAKKELEKTFVDVRQYRIIYDAVNDIKNALEGLLEAKTLKKFQSRIEIREVFKLSKQGIVAGCYVTKGKVLRKAKVDVIRNGDIVHSGTISSLKRFKDDVREVNEGTECGITLDNYDKIQAGDILEAYEIEKVAQTL
jgi:translation initiation factor IF-2